MRKNIAFSAMASLALLTAMALFTPAPVAVADQPTCEERCTGGSSIPIVCTLECRLLLGPGGEETPEFLDCFNECTIRFQACIAACDEGGVIPPPVGGCDPPCPPGARCLQHINQCVGGIIIGNGGGVKP